MAKPILIANWKNHPSSLDEAKLLLRQMSKDSRFYKKLSFFIAPPTTYFESVSRHLGRLGQLATQNISSLPSGSYTGRITPDILKSFGVRLAIVGHSERRQYGETSKQIARKVRVALRAGIVPLVCIGEVSRDQDGEYFEFLREELKVSLEGLNRQSDISKLMLAYEPIWAIGKSAEEAITPVDLSQMVIFIKKVLTDIFGRRAAERVPILYGGSVEPTDAEALWRETGVRGFLVGHASLEAKSLKAIAESLGLKKIK